MTFVVLVGAVVAMDPSASSGNDEERDLFGEGGTPPNRPRPPTLFRACLTRLLRRISSILLRVRSIIASGSSSSDLLSFLGCAYMSKMRGRTRIQHFCDLPHFSALWQVR